MEKYVRAVLEMQGIRLPEQDYGILSEQMAGIVQMRAAVEEEHLDELNMQLFLIPNGGDLNE